MAIELLYNGAVINIGCKNVLSIEVEIKIDTPIYFPEIGVNVPLLYPSVTILLFLSVPDGKTTFMPSNIPDPTNIPPDECINSD